MNRSVIVATARSPIGRAFKGSLIDVRPDDMAAEVVTALLAKAPGLDPATVEDVILGCAQPAGEQGVLPVGRQLGPQALGPADGHPGHLGQRNAALREALATVAVKGAGEPREPGRHAP